MARHTSTGACALCGRPLTKRGATAHLDECAPAHDAPSGPATTLARFRIAAVGAATYWLDAEARTTATLSSLDSFLRRTWLECCGHLSMLKVGPYRYLPAGVGTLDPFGGGDAERSMSTKIGLAFPQVGAKGLYDYDFGSTTRLTVTLTDARQGRLGRTAIRLLARNDPPASTCGICGAMATLICCAHETEDSPFVCAKHEKAHPCRDRTFLPVVNSPRMGVCGYSG